METVVEQLSDCERELHRRTGGKPEPTLIHGAIQANLIVQLAVNYPNQFRIASEVTLDTKPDGSTPDLVLYPFGEAVLVYDSPFHYAFFHHAEVLKDQNLHIEINLPEVFR